MKNYAGLFGKKLNTKEYLSLFPAESVSKKRVEKEKNKNEKVNKQFLGS